MNYAIPNERLNNLMSDYLNDFMDGCNVSKFDSFIALSKKNHDDFEYTEVLMEYDYSDSRLWMDTNTVNNFITWFPISRPEAKKFIKDWFENTFNVKISYVS
jgi:hypothetical protein